METLNKDILSEISECLLHSDLYNLKLALPTLNIIQDLFEVTKERSIEFLENNYCLSHSLNESINQILESDQDCQYLIRRIDWQDNYTCRITINAYVYKTLFELTDNSFEEFKIYRFFIHYRFKDDFVCQYIIDNGYQLFKFVFKDRIPKIEQLSDLAETFRITKNEQIKTIIIELINKLELDSIDEYQLTIDPYEYGRGIILDDLAVDLETLILIYHCLDKKTEGIFN